MEHYRKQSRKWKRILKAGAKPQSSVKYSRVTNNKIRNNIAKGLDEITEAMMKHVTDDYAKAQIFKAIGSLGDYLLDTDIRFVEVKL